MTLNTKKAGGKKKKAAGKKGDAKGQDGPPVSAEAIGDERANLLRAIVESFGAENWANNPETQRHKEWLRGELDAMRDAATTAFFDNEKPPTAKDIMGVRGRTSAIKGMISRIEDRERAVKRAVEKAISYETNLRNSPGMKLYYEAPTWGDSSADWLAHAKATS